MIEYFNSFYAIVLILLILNLLFIFYSVLFLKKINRLYVLLIYSILYLLQTLYSIYVQVFEQFNLQKEKVLDNSLCLFTVLEFILFYSFIIKSISPGKSRLVFKLISISFLCLAILNWFSLLYPVKGISLNAIEAYLIIIACLYYYYEIFISPPAIKLPADPIFWSVTGMFFQSIIIIPVFLQKETIHIKSCLVRDVYPHTLIGYIVLFILFINALRCQIQLSD